MGKIMYQITLATSNKHKVDEINLIAKDYDVEFVLPVGEFDPVEDSDNFIGNAYCKAKCASLNASTDYVLADDSGLCVQALKGAPGIYSARYAKSADERIKKLLFNMKDKKDRNAEFVCAMVVVNKKGEILFKTEQTCEGSIMYEPKGKGGFGYDPIFFVKSENKGMAELTDLEKSKISNRAKALNCVLNWLKENK